MPKTQTPDPEKLRAEAQELARQAAEVQEELDRISLEEYQREQEELAERDRQNVAAFNRAQLDKAVDDAYRAFEDEIATHPLTVALATYQAATWRRNWAYADTNAARSRLDMPSLGNAPSPVIPDITDGIKRAAERLAQAEIDAERSQA